MESAEVHQARNEFVDSYNAWLADRRELSAAEESGEARDWEGSDEGAIDLLGAAVKLIDEQSALLRRWESEAAALFARSCGMQS